MTGLSRTGKADALPWELSGNGPYTARSAADGKPDWPYWYVTNNGRTNNLRFPGGAVLTDRASAEEIVKIANGGQ